MKKLLALFLSLTLISACFYAVLGVSAELADGAASAAELSDSAVSAELSDGSAPDEAYCATARADEHKDGMPVEDIVSGGDGAHEKAEEAAE